MGLFPHLDSPHYGKAHVITVVELESIINDRVLKYIPKEGYGSTAGSMDTNADLAALWKSNRNEHAYYLYVIVDGSVWTINGVVFSKYPGQYLNLLVGAVGKGPNFDFGFGGIDRTGKMIDNDNFTFIKEGNDHTHNPSSIMYYRLLLKNADFFVSIDSLSDNDVGKRKTTVNMSIKHSGNILLSLNADLQYTTICRCVVTDAITKKEYTFNGQIPYESLDNKGQLPLEIKDKLIVDLKDTLAVNLPDFFIVEDITFHYLGGWELI